jgi:hypothetical protein
LEKCSVIEGFICVYRLKLNAEVIPPHAMKALGGEEIWLLLILDLSTRCG